MCLCVLNDDTQLKPNRNNHTLCSTMQYSTTQKVHTAYLQGYVQQQLQLVLLPLHVDGVHPVIHQVLAVEPDLEPTDLETSFERLSSASY